MSKIKHAVSSTRVDLHNECLSYEGLCALVDQAQKAFVQVGIEHDPRIPPVGRVENVEIVQAADGEYDAAAMIELFDSDLTEPQICGYKNDCGRILDKTPAAVDIVRSRDS